MAPPSSAQPSGLAGKTIVITGGNSGIGLATAQALTRRGARVVLAVRDLDKGRRAADGLGGEVEVRRLDLADLASVREFAAGWGVTPISVLINNAGVSLPTLERTADGFERQFGTNHLGPFALTNLLLPQVTDRIVTVASMAERTGRLNFDDLNYRTSSYKESRAYAGSKLANLLFVAGLQRRLDAAGSSVTAYAAHPGFVATNIYDQTTGFIPRLAVRLLAQSPTDGALPVLYATTVDIPAGAFTGPQRLMHMRGGAEVITASKQAQDPALAERLWAASEELTDIRFPL